MKKTLLASVVAGLGLGLAGSAMAQGNGVQLYGLIDAFVGQEKTNAGSTMKVDSGGMTTSFWGVKGTEDLGGGLKAVFNLEAFISNDTGAAGRFPGDLFFARTANVGLSGGFGTVTLGRNTTPYFVSTLLANPFGDSFAFSPEILRTYGTRGYANFGDTGWSNSILYSGNFGGVGLNAIYTLGDESLTTSRSGKGFGLSANYFSGPLMVSAAYQTKNLSAATGKQDSFRIGAAYDFGAAKVFGSYQTTSDKDGAATAGFTNGDHKGFQVGASVPVGGGAVLASYSNTKSTATGATSATRGIWALGYDYNLSKRTDVYAAYYRDSGDTAFVPVAWQTSISRFGLGIRHRF